MIETMSKFRPIQEGEFDYVLLLIPYGQVPSYDSNKVPIITAPWLEPLGIHNMFRDAMEYQGKWNQEMFDKVYKPTYVKHIDGNRYAREALQELVRLDKAGKRVAIVTQYEDKRTCFRTILARKLRNMGAHVVWH